MLKKILLVIRSAAIVVNILFTVAVFGTIYVHFEVNKETKINASGIFMYKDEVTAIIKNLNFI